MKLIKYKKKPKIPPLFLPLEKERPAEFLRHLILLQCNIAYSYFIEDQEKSKEILESILKEEDKKPEGEEPKNEKDNKDKKDIIDKKEKKKKEKEKKEKEKKEKKEKEKKEKEKEKEKKKKDKKKSFFSKESATKKDDIDQDPNYFELPPIPVLTPEEEEEQKKLHMRKIFKWCVECFLNRFKDGPIERPETPFDYSNILPEFQNVNTLYAYAQMPSDDLSKVYQAYPYDFFKVCSQMTPKFANDFIIACLFNRKVPIPIGSRLISFFPLTQIQIDYTLVYEKRCHNFHDMCMFFEGLLCNYNNQVKAAELLAGDFEKTVFTDECVLLINSSIRSFSHFIDKNLSKTIELFPSGATISFLIETATTPLSELSKKLKAAQPNELITKLINQIALLELLNINDSWSKLEESSVPALLEQLYKDDRINTEILFELPRNSIFFTYSSHSWETDFDFIQAFSAIQTLLLEHSPNFYPPYLNYDLFSLLFLTKPKKNQSSADDESKNGSESDLLNDCNKDIIDYLGKPTKPVEYFYDIESALKLIGFMRKNGQPPEDLIPYLDSAERKIKAAQILYESPTINETLLTKDIYYVKSLKSLDSIAKISEIFGDVPKYVLSKKFALKIIAELGSDIANHTKVLPIYGRAIPGQTVLEKVDNIVSQALSDFPKELHPQLILDFSSSYKKYPLLSKRLETEEYKPYLNDISNAFIKNLQVFYRKYPNLSVLSLGESRSIFDYKKRLSAIISTNMQNSYLDRFARYLYALITIKSQSFYKFHTVRPQGQLQVLFNTIQSLESLRETMKGTGIEPIQYLLNKNRPDLCNQNFFEKAVGEDPMIFIPFAQNSVDPAKLASYITNEKFGRVKRYFEVCKASSKSQTSSAKEADTLAPEESPKPSKPQHQPQPSQTAKSGSNSNIAGSGEEKEATPPTDDAQSVKQILQNLESIEDKEEKMNILEDLLYNNKDISKCTAEILEIIQIFPQVWCVNFIETFIALLEPEDSSLIPLLEFLNMLNPRHKKDLEAASEKVRVQMSYDYLTQLVTNFNDILERPNDYFRLCGYHLKSHLVEREMIGCLRYFCLILICVRNFKIFKTKEKEEKWISKYQINEVSSINIEKLGKMIVDIGLNYSFDCGKRLADLCPEIDLSTHIKKTMPNSVKLLSYVKDPNSLVTSILSEQKVSNEADEVRLLHFLAKIGSIHNHPSFANSDFNANNIPLFKILNEISRCYISYRRRIRYAGASLHKLYDMTVMTDTLSLIPIFKEMGVEMSPIVKTMVENSYTIFGLVPNESTATTTASNNATNAGNQLSSSTRKKIFTSPKLSFDVRNDLIEMSNSLSSSSEQPTLYMIESNPSESNYLTVYQKPLQKRDIKVNYKPDYSYYEMQDKSNDDILKIGIGIGNDIGNGITLCNFATESFNSKKESNNSEQTETEKPPEQTIKFVNTANMLKTISEYVGQVNLEKLFESLPTKHLQMLLKFANAKGLIHMIFKLCCWVEDHPEQKEVFIFPKSSFKEYRSDNPDLKKKLNEFISTLRNVLLKGLEFTPYVDSNNLLPSRILSTGNTKLLKDVQTLVQYQSEIGIRNMNLFASKTNKAAIVMKLFYESEYEKAFTMTRIFRIDLNQILIKTVKALLGNKSDMPKVGKFLFNVAPRLDIDSANKLIESIALDLANNDENRPFLNLLVTGIDDSRNVFQLLNNYGLRETAAMVALQEDLNEEIVASFKDIRNKDNSHILRSCTRWIRQYDDRPLLIE